MPVVPASQRPRDAEPDEHLPDQHAADQRRLVDLVLDLGHLVESIVQITTAEIRRRVLQLVVDVPAQHADPRQDSSHSTWHGPGIRQGLRRFRILVGLFFDRVDVLGALVGLLQHGQLREAEPIRGGQHLVADVQHGGGRLDQAVGLVELPVRHGTSQLERRGPAVAVGGELGVGPACLCPIREPLDVIAGQHMTLVQLDRSLRSSDLFQEVEEMTPIDAGIEYLRLGAGPVGDLPAVQRRDDLRHGFRPDLVEDLVEDPPRHGVRIRILFLATGCGLDPRSQRLRTRIVVRQALRFRSLPVDPFQCLV